MKPAWAVAGMLAAILVIAAPVPAAEKKEAEADWTVYVTNDNCPDYTWGLTEEQTRQAYADIVRGHLDEMNRTDKEAAASQDRYNMAVTNEALAFVEKYPDRKDELIKRIKEGREFVSPYLCNTLWGFQSTEGTIRAFYPARRLDASGASPDLSGPSTSSCRACRGAPPRFFPAAASGGCSIRSTTTTRRSRT